MSVEIRDDRGRGVLEAFDGDGEALGQIVYFTLDEPDAVPEVAPEAAPEAAPVPVAVAALVPVHTEVAAAHQGEGVAGALAGELYAIAGREGLAVVPLCPYVVKWAERHPERAPAASDDLTRAALDKVRTDPSAW
ncbi:N-acetyltransferase [Streptomyces sp. WAC 01529]|uniref:GNAT family N-acetyltransferase n=1 Tax=Streptomyces sp. WAC 01529 TaxID=2203205 RepID=UPI000F6D579D|nr:GNAT family N-acetyltransferase [Streptomyces sp. WAC 01529]AZM56960.1 N-acetyltransferase [Streptomyces sp. WAC 01529]